MTTINLGRVVGQDGANGEDGRGIISIDKTSTQGLVDTYTITYTDETTSTFEVTNGANGANGANGTDGTDGEDGRGIVSILKTATVGLVDTYTITYTDNTTSTFEVTNGEDGSAGTTDYTDLSNKPKINNVELSGNKSLGDLGVQAEIDSTHKLSADNVDDSNTTNKFVTASDKTTWNAKQDAIDSTHKLSADLVDDTETTNKFVTASDKVAWNAKQNALVSGTNIKTINNESILGSGNITVEGGATNNQWKDKVISIMGDSISTFQGWIPTADGHNLNHVYYYPKTGLTDVTKTWWYSLIDELGAKLGVNESWSGSYVGNTSDSEIITGGNNYGTKACMAGNTRIENLGANGTPDLILVYGGTNDVWTGNSRMGETVPGTFDSSVAYDINPTTLLATNKWTSFADAYRDMLLKMMYYYPKSRIVVLFPFYSDLGNGAYTHAKLDAFIEVQRNICDYFGVNYIDLRDCGINAGNVAASKNKDGYTTILVGNVHPNIDGMALMKDYIKARLLSFFETDEQETIVYTVTNSLTVNTNSDRYITGVRAGSSYKATITGSSLGLVKVYMGNTEITSTAYNSSTGVINIASVTGNITIAEEALQTYTITTNVTGGSSTGDNTIMTAGTASVTIVPNSNMALPTSVTVSGANYSYNSTTGVISLSNPTGNVTIKAVCVALQTYTITTNVTDGSYSGDTEIVETRTAQVTISPSSGYQLPVTITVTGATYSYDNTTGVVSLSAATGNVSITAVCVLNPVSYTITTSISDGSYSGDTEIFQNNTAQVVLSANLNYALPSSITVSGATYTYDSTTGIVALSAPTGNVTISATCEARGWFSSNYNANDAAHRTGEAKTQFAGFSYKAGVYDGDGIKMNAVRFMLKNPGTLTVGKVAADFKSVISSETVTVTGSNGDAKEIMLQNTYTLENGEHFFISKNTDTCTFQYSNSSNAAANGQHNFYLYAGTASLDAGNRPTEVLSVDFGYFEAA